MFGILLGFLSFCVSVLFPVYASFNAIKCNDDALLKPWLIYWVVFACFGAFESFFGFVLGFIPFYSVIKLYIQVWLILPQTRGSIFVYNYYLSPFLTAHESQIESFVNNAHKDLWSFLVEITDYGLAVIKVKVLRMKVNKPLQSPTKGYINSFYSYFSTSETGEHAGEDGNDGMTKSYMDSLLDQFKEDKSSEGPYSFLQSLISTVSVTGLFSSPDHKPSSKTGTPKLSAKRSTSRVASGQTTPSKPKPEELFDVVGNDDNLNEGLLSNLGWVKVSKDKTE